MTNIRREPELIRSITDNWIIQHVAEIAAVKGPFKTEKLSWVEFDGGRLVERLVSREAIQVICLATFIEQLVLSDELYVMPEFTGTWKTRHRTLDSLFASGVIREFPTAEEGQEEARRPLIEQLSVYPGVREILEECVKPEETKIGSVSAIASTTIRGAAGYLGLSMVYQCAYSPHPIRARFLEKTLYNPNRWPSAEVIKVQEFVNRPRLKVSRAVFGEAQLSSLDYKLPSISLACLNESSTQVNVLDVAWQLRNEPAIKDLRRDLALMSDAIHEENVKSFVRLAKKLEAAVLEVERQLGLRKHDTGIDGPGSIKVAKVPLSIPVPDALRRPVKTPKHSVLINRFASTGMKTAKQILGKSLGIQQKTILDEIVDFYARKTGDSSQS